MKKGYYFVILAVLVLTVSGILVISKSSYADTQSTKNYCPNSFDDFYVSLEDIDLVSNGSNWISMPLEINIYDANYVNLSRVYATNGFDLFGKRNNYPNISRYDSFTAVTSSIELGYLVNQFHFSSDIDEDYYYKQIFLLWAMDRLYGYEDQYNYLGDEKTSFDYIYRDKLDYYISWYSVWRYSNNLSAGDKEMLKGSSVGNTMLESLEKWEEFVTWHLEDGIVKLDNIAVDDMSYYVTNDYIETQLITPTSTGQPYSDLFRGYRVTVSSPMVVVNKDGEEQTEFDAGESFKVRIPISEIKNQAIDYSIEIVGDFDFPTAVLYSGYMEPERQDVDNARETLYGQLHGTFVLDNCIHYETLTAKQNLEFTQRVGNLDVQVIDTSTGNNLSSVKVAIFDGDGNEVYRYETTEDILHLILPVGNYVVRQTSTPANYEAITIEMRVSVLENNTSEVILENVPLVNVPNTAMDAIIFIIIGGLIVVAGGIVLAINIRIEKTN